MAAAVVGEGAQAPALPDAATRTLISLASLFAVMMVTIDGTIAIIALPRIQSSLAASQEQIAWVLTSYLVAGAIATPLSGWLADRFGRTKVMAVSVLAFTFASLGCGVSANLEMLVVFRTLQGAFGACLVPLSQVLLMDVYPPEQQGKAISMFGIGTLFGPMIGPTLGGWLTENFNWRWIFLINLAPGVIAFAGLLIFARRAEKPYNSPFDLRGFVFVSIVLAAFQLMLDRGQMLDWLSSTEICIEAALVALFLYISIVHMLTVRNPFIQPSIFMDRNFLVGSVLSVLIGILLNGIIPIVTGMMQQLLGFPVMLAGILSLPRALGNMLTILFAGRIVTQGNARILVFLGLLMILASLHILMNLSLDARQDSLAMVAFLQGCGSGLIMLPLMLVVFSTLPHNLRNQGSTLFALIRSVAGAGGISVIQAMTIRDAAAVQSRLVENIRPDNPLVALRGDFELAAMVGQVMRQAQMVAYVDTYRAIFIMALVMAPLCLLLRANTDDEAQPVTMHAGD